MFTYIPSTQTSRDALAKLRTPQAITLKEAAHVALLGASTFAVLYFVMLMAQLFLAGSWVGSTYTYQGKVVECFGADACDWYSDRRASHIDTFISFSEPLRNAFWPTLIFFGITIVVMIIEVLNRMSGKRLEV